MALFDNYWVRALLLVGFWVAYLWLIKVVYKKPKSTDQPPLKHEHQDLNQ
ncbi:hypothetical protein ACYATM_00820 [Lactobacillaceae bacterium Scapto_B20]